MTGLLTSPLVGVMRVADGMGRHIGRGDVTFAMASPATVLRLDLRVRRVRVAPVTLHQRHEPER